MPSNHCNNFQNLVSITRNPCYLPHLFCINFLLIFYIFDRFLFSICWIDFQIDFKSNQYDFCWIQIIFGRPLLFEYHQFTIFELVFIRSFLLSRMAFQIFSFNLHWIQCMHLLNHRLYIFTIILLYLAQFQLVNFRRIKNQWRWLWQINSILHNFQRIWKS
jgi:hypothetical protein